MISQGQQTMDMQSNKFKKWNLKFLKYTIFNNMTYRH